jgi:RimJ/RimL family protein N-acetyltransferase
LDAALTFERLEEHHLPFLLEVRNECRSFLHDDRSFTLNECEVWFRTARPEFWLIRCDGEPIGYFRISNRNPAERSIYVGADLHSRFRGRGLAKAAYEQFLPLLREEDVLIARLEVLGHNVRAQGLYARLGFVEIGRKTGVARRNGVPVDSIIMERLL